MTAAGRDARADLAGIGDHRAIDTLRLTSAAGLRIGLASFLAASLGACAAPRGVAVDACAPDFAPHRAATAEGFSRDPRLVEIECWRLADDRLLEVGVRMPPGPTCFVVDRVEQLEGPDAVGVSVFIGELVSPLAGACPEEEQTWSVEIQLREPLGERPVLDGARRPEDAGDG